MSNAFFVLIGLMIVGFAVVIVYLDKRLGSNKQDDKSLLMLQQQLNQVSEQLSKGLSESQNTIQKQFASSTSIIKDVTEKLTKLEDTNKQVVSIADQLQGLEQVLKNPKHRGIFGEYSLEVLLKNAFSPKDYKMQYSLGIDEKTGKELVVDAALFIGDKVIPIDSKFSLENFTRIISEKNKLVRDKLEKDFKQDLKNRIDETAKYIRPDKGTVDYAFMFIPAEGVFYDILVNEIGGSGVNARDLLSYATIDKKVNIVSPTTFYAALQSTLQGMKAYKIQESTVEIIKNVVVLGNHIKAYNDYFNKLGGHLSTTVNSYNAAYKELGKIDKDVTKITGEKIGVEALQIDKPNQGE